MPTADSYTSVITTEKVSWNIKFLFKAEAILYAPGVFLHCKFQSPSNISIHILDYLLRMYNAVIRYP